VSAVILSIHATASKAVTSGRIKPCLLRNASKCNNPITNTAIEIVESEQSKDMTLSVGGNPVYLDKAEDYSKRINILFPIAVFHRLFEQPHHAHTPCHSKQSCNEWQNQTLLTAECFKVLKRYYEDFDRLIAQGMEPKVANSEAVVQSLVRVGTDDPDSSKNTE
jgi:hypothetical protein